MIQTSVRHTVKMQLPSWTWGLHQGAAKLQQKGYENYLITQIPAAPVTAAGAAAAVPPVCCSQPPSPSYLHKYQGGFAGWWLAEAANSSS